MSRSFGSNEHVIKFKKYTRQIENTYETMTPGELKKEIKNWKNGLAKMQGIAVGYGMYYRPEPVFLAADSSGSVTWVKSKFPGIGDIIYGLWDGRDHVKVTYEGRKRHVFNKDYLGKLVEGFTDKKKAQKMMLDLIVRFDGQEMKPNE